ncbi:Pr6Pr family membrane protein [Sinomonas sp. ASV322]|uniref:Pr6Pr family membrane protein n=1 Tax=Sinomonas sp. ASV322 TaxID=3041920 RepID=UPI0027DDDCFB|nr:Pr6Pr family membrane protein [Sinomonas sp. ASV322]MDQ4501672.1 Pr6Pr family membrane protein [Sinomonas sp. ASV322]
MKRNIFVGARFFFAALTFAAVGTQLVIGVQRGADIVNFFSYFTILSNVFTAVVLAISGYRVFVGRRPTEADDVIRGTATIAIAIVGIVFGLLLSNQDVGIVAPWVNVVTHYVMPVVMVADWLFQPPLARLELRHLWWWLLYPVAYLVYSLIRGAFVGWYPYWFIDPARAGGWGGVAVFALGIAVGFLVVSLAMLWLGNKLHRNVDY